jgi:hypothetical protein
MKETDLANLIAQLHAQHALLGAICHVHPQRSQLRDAFLKLCEVHLSMTEQSAEIGGKLQAWIDQYVAMLGPSGPATS